MPGAQKFGLKTSLLVHFGPKCTSCGFRTQWSMIEIARQRVSKYHESYKCDYCDYLNN